MQFEELKGKTLTAVEVSSDRGEVTFTVADGQKFRLYHSQICCESVDVESVAGDLADLIGSPLLQAEEVSNSDTWPEGVEKACEPESFTWTFYKLATVKGSVTIRWYGTSNGYYLERVSFEEVA